MRKNKRHCNLMSSSKFDALITRMNCGIDNYGRIPSSRVKLCGSVVRAGSLPSFRSRERIDFRSTICRLSFSTSQDNFSRGSRSAIGRVSFRNATNEMTSLRRMLSRGQARARASFFRSCKWRWSTRGQPSTQYTSSLGTKAGTARRDGRAWWNETLNISC